MSQRKRPRLEASGGPAVTVPPPAQSLIRQIDGLTQTQEDPEPMPSNQFDADLIVIGAGPGGYVGAIRAAQLGAQVICVEQGYLGGTCLNVGCIPSKALIASVDRLQHVKHADQLGVIVPGEPKIDFEKMLARKDKIVATQRGGIAHLFKKNGVRHVEGFASFKDANTIEVVRNGEKSELRGRHFLLAMGSGVIYLQIPGLEGGREQNVWTSDDAVAPPFLPESMFILGGGAVGVEFAYVYAGLGCKVTLAEMMPTLIPMFDSDLGVELGKQLSRQGIGVMTGATLEKASKTKKGWNCTIKQGSEAMEVVAQVVLLGVGRKAMTDNMNLERVGVRLHKRGVELVDDSMRTHAPNIYAVGDVTGRVQLAHVASHEAIVAVENIVRGRDRKVDYRAVPNCVYTVPEVASVGLTQSEAEAKGYDVTVGKFLFRPLGKAMASAEQEGFVKVVAEKKYGEVLGVHMIGAHVTDMIHEAVVAIKLEATLADMVDTIHAHPTMSEAILEAFEDADGHSIHKG